MENLEGHAIIENVESKVKSRDVSAKAASMAQAGQTHFLEEEKCAFILTRATAKIIKSAVLLEVALKMTLAAYGERLN